ncbi:MAG: 30S ribosomal protein S9 [bacterium]
MEKKGYIEAVGRRKTSVARVRAIVSSKASITVNDRTMEEYFPVKIFQNHITEVLKEAGIEDKYTITVKVNGGGVSSQSQAVRQGLARLLAKAHPETKTTIKKAGMLTRDAREKERRKFGLKKARKAPQWSKR